MSYTRGEIVGLYWLASLKEFRDTDCEVALAQRALIDARTNGARMGVMPSHEGANSVTRKLKFAPYCQFKVYAWPSSPLRMPVC